MFGSRTGRGGRSGRGGTADLGRGESLREAFWNRPPWIDGTLARRILAALLAMVAVVLYFRGDPDGERAPVVVARHDLPPGHLLQPEDLRTVSHESRALPAAAISNPGTLTGAVLAGAMRPGEMFTDLRVVGPRLAAAAADDGRIVPIRLADNAVAGILRGGDRVDVIAAAETEHESPPSSSRTLASDATVVLVSGAEDEHSPGNSTQRVVLAAMDSRDAAQVAAASLSTALTVVFH